VSALPKAGERYLRIKEVSERLSLSTKTIRTWVADGRFGEILRLTPKDYRIAESALQQFIQSHMA
jgi:excisionase family DNA binding protein